MNECCTIQGPRVLLRPFVADDVAALTEMHKFNRDVFAPVMPERPEDFFTVAAQKLAIDGARRQWELDRGYAFAVTLDSRVIGRVALSNVVRGAWQNATLGYWIDSRFQGQGFATESVRGIILGAFEHFALHRIQAAILPSNLPSLAVIVRAGFCEEGLARFYLNIAGQWQDHRIFSLTQEQYRRPPGFSLHAKSNI